MAEKSKWPRYTGGSRVAYLRRNLPMVSIPRAMDLLIDACHDDGQPAIGHMLAYLQPSLPQKTEKLLAVASSMLSQWKAGVADNKMVIGLPNGLQPGSRVKASPRPTPPAKAAPRASNAPKTAPQYVLPQGAAKVPVTRASSVPATEGKAPVAPARAPVASPDRRADLLSQTPLGRSILRQRGRA